MMFLVKICKSKISMLFLKPTIWARLWISALVLKHFGLLSNICAKLNACKKCLCHELENATSYLTCQLNFHFMCSWSCFTRKRAKLRHKTQQNDGCFIETTRKGLTWRILSAQKESLFLFTDRFAVIFCPFLL